MTPNLLGVSHLAFSVPDLAAAVRFWVEVLGFEPVNDDPQFRFLLNRTARMAVVVTDHGGAVEGVFDESRPGLDHLGLAVPDLDTLEAWRTALDGQGVTHSGCGRHRRGLAPEPAGPGQLPDRVLRDERGLRRLPGPRPG